MHTINILGIIASLSKPNYFRELLFVTERKEWGNERQNGENGRIGCLAETEQK